MPSFLMKSHAAFGEPPLQPSGFELKHRSCAESGMMVLPSVEMHRRSEAASAVPNAQQQPHMDWSRMSPMTLAHLGKPTRAS